MQQYDVVKHAELTEETSESIQNLEISLICLLLLLYLLNYAINSMLSQNEHLIFNIWQKNFLSIM